MKSTMTQRALLVALLAGSGVLAASAYAMNGGPDGKPGCEMRHGQAMHERMVDRHDKRLAELKDKLKLAPAQTAAWQTFAEAEKPRQPAQDREAMRAAYAKMNTPQRLDAMLERSEVRHAQKVARAAAVKSFYVQLTPEQQAVFDAQAKPGRGHGHHGKASQQS